MNSKNKKVVIIGASSGMGMEVAKLLLDEGCQLGVAARREDRLQALKQLAPDRVVTALIDVTDEDAPHRLRSLIDEMGGMDLFFYSSGIGKQNRTLEPDIELNTFNTNAMVMVTLDSLLDVVTGVIDGLIYIPGSSLVCQ